MIIENRWFAFQAPRRVDLSGMPFGFLFMWRPRPSQKEVWIPFNRDDPTDHPDRGFFSVPYFAPLECSFSFGLYLPLPLKMFDLLARLFPAKYVALELSQLNDKDSHVPHDWRRWPSDYREASEAAVRRELRPDWKIVSDNSYCSRRIDLSKKPLQLYRSIVIKRAA